MASFNLVENDSVMPILPVQFKQKLVQRIARQGTKKDKEFNFGGCVSCRCMNEFNSVKRLHVGGGRSKQIVLNPLGHAVIIVRRADLIGDFQHVGVRVGHGHSPAGFTKHGDVYQIVAE